MFYDVEVEIKTRKYAVDTERLKELLHSHRSMTIQEIAQRLCLTETQVAHYFRIDRFGKKAGKGALIQWERSGTLGVSQDQTLIVWMENGKQDTDREKIF